MSTLKDNPQAFHFEHLTLLNQLPIGIFIIRDDYTVLFWNNTLEKWLGIPSGDILNQAVHHHFPLLKSPENMTRLEQVFRTGTPLIFSHQLHKDLFWTESQRKNYSFSVLVTALPAGDSEQYHAVFTLQDVSDLVLQVEQNKKMHEKALLEIESRKKAERVLRNVNKKLENISRTDPLTGLPNRRDILEKISYEFKRSNRNKKPICLIICDVDNFKSFNDTFGHDCGDFVLVSVARQFEALLRAEDSAARWGGEEFLMLLPETALEQGQKTAERIRTAIAQSSFVYKQIIHHITMTFGVKCCTAFQIRKIEQQIESADRALLRGKRNGKNRVELADLAD